MNSICIKYNKCTAEFPLHIITFFNLIGLNVHETYFGMNDIQTVPESVSKIQINDTRNFDAYLFVLSNKDDLVDYNNDIKSLDLQKVVAVKTFEFNDNLLTLESDNKSNIKNLLEILHKQGVILASVYEEMLSICDALYSSAFVQNYYLAKHFKNMSTEANNKISDILNNVLLNLADILKEKGLAFGDQGLFYTQFACANLMYELNVFRTKAKVGITFDTNALLEVVAKIDNAVQGKLGASTLLLSAKIYDKLLDDPNKAYEFWCKCEIDKCNPYLYLMKGLYWQRNTKNYLKALNYFSNAVAIDSNYYLAWYYIGICYKQINDYKNAHICFENVYKCLYRKFKCKTILPHEIKTMYVAMYWSSQGFLYQRRFGNAIEDAERCLEIYKSLNNSLLYEVLAVDVSSNELIEYTRKNIYGESSFDLLITLYENIGDTKQAYQYRNLKEQYV